MPKRETIDLFLMPSLDAQRKEHANILLLKDARVKRTYNPYRGAILVMDVAMLKKKPEIPPNQMVIILNLGDLYQNHIGLREEDEEYRKYLAERNVTFIYLQCELEPTDTRTERWVKRSIYHGDEHILLLPMPMGYISGSKINLHYKDMDSSAFHAKNLARRNGNSYLYDWCWIGTPSSVERIEAIDILIERMDYDSAFMAINEIAIKNPDVKAYVKTIHADNKAIPYDKFMEIHRKSKIAVSCNGLGMWCYKDCEMLARNVFVLRQWHKNLSLNPISPKDGTHWKVFRNNELNELIDYYLTHDKEREEIADEGHDYFRKAINGGWAESYVSALLEYRETRNRHAFGDLLLR